MESVDSSKVHRLIWGREGLDASGYAVLALGLFLAAYAYYAPTCIVPVPGGGGVGVSIFEHNLPGSITLLSILGAGTVLLLLRRRGYALILLGIYFFASLYTAAQGTCIHGYPEAELGPGFYALIASGIVIGIIPVYEDYRIMKGYTLSQTLCEIASWVAYGIARRKPAKCWQSTLVVLLALAAIAGTLALGKAVIDALRP